MASNLSGLPPVIDIPALGDLFAVCSSDYRRLRIVFGLLNEHVCILNECLYDDRVTENGVNWAWIRSTALSDITKYRETQTAEYVRVEDRVSDELIQQLWLQHRDSITVAIQVQLTPSQILGLGELATCEHLRRFERWIVECTFYDPLNSFPDDVDPMSVRADLLKYVEQPQFIPGGDTIMPSDLRGVLRALADDCEKRTGSRACSVEDVRHVLEEVIQVTHNMCVAVKACMEDERYWTAEYSVDEYDPMGGLESRVKMTVIEPFQIMLGDPNSSIPIHVRRFLAASPPFQASETFLDAVGLRHFMRPGFLSQEAKNWLDDQEAGLESAFSVAIEALSALSHDPDFGQQIEEILKGWDTVNFISGITLDMELAAWFCYDYCRSYLEEHEDEDGNGDGDVDMLEAVLVDVPLQATGPLISVDTVSSAFNGIASEGLCGICYCDYCNPADRCVQITKCSHVFHAGCLDLWINAVFKGGHVQCPLCRTQLRSARTFIGNPNQ